MSKRKMDLINRYYTQVDSIDGKIYILDLNNKVYKKMRDRSSSSNKFILYISIFLLFVFVFLYAVFGNYLLPIRYRGMPLFFNNLVFLIMTFLLYILIDYIMASKCYHYYLDLLHRYIMIEQGESTIIFVNKQHNKKLDMTFLENMGVVVDNNFLKFFAARKVDQYHFDDRDALLTIQLLEQVNIHRYIEDHKSDFSFEVYTDCKLLQGKRDYDIYSGKINVSTGKEIIEKRTTFRVYKIYSKNDKFKNGVVLNDN